MKSITRHFRAPVPAYRAPARFGVCYQRGQPTAWARIELDRRIRSRRDTQDLDELLYGQDNRCEPAFRRTGDVDEGLSDERAAYLLTRTLSSLPQTLTCRWMIADTENWCDGDAGVGRLVER